MSVTRFQRAMRHWRTADARACVAEKTAVEAFARYVSGTGALPNLMMETEAAVARQEAFQALEAVYAEAKRLRAPSEEEVRTSVPGALGGE
ncbi:hypothetical protein [Ramlibacter humi]|uniref:Uncharacterized protein n=1 Tax=Ramlibacter humi TaxID=2530451 RepID=A0A4Z0C9N1_9BURK|nr:hypothetical protein [Ramlibacter humi]TFZ08313.1 hypothetical protein EZ216_03905 [Ramlibacter humi]